MLGPWIGFAALAACVARGPMLTARVTATEGGCDIAIGDRHFAPGPGSDDSLYAFLRSWRGRHAVVRAELDTPYRCVGGLIFALQRTHFRIEDMTFNGMRWDDPRLREGLHP